MKHWESHISFKDALRLLKTKLPCAYPVRVRRVERANGDSAAWLQRRAGKWEFVIHVAKSPCEICEVDCLLHEFAHCHSRTHNHDQTEDQLKHHDAAWGVSYAACYRIVHLGGES